MARAVRTVTVLDKEQITPNMVRITLSGDELADFPEGYEGGYIKLVFPGESVKPVVRSYTIRSFSPSKELTLDMVAHGDTGPAARWALQVNVGDQVAINGPGACQRVNTDADWFLLAGDMSALPAISVNLETLPAHAKGHLVLEIISDDDQVDVDVPEGMNVHWVVNPEPEEANTVLEDTVMALPWGNGKVSAWVAGEFSASRTLRQYLRHEREVPKGSMYVSCYWKIGETDEGMKAAKRADAEPW